MVITDVKYDETDILLKSNELVLTLHVLEYLNICVILFPIYS